MISGQVTRAWQAEIPVVLLDAAGQPRRTPARIDTGFADDLTLPGAAIEALGLSRADTLHRRLGHGQMAAFNTYHAIILWEGSPRPIIVLQSAVHPLIGVGLLRSSNLSIDYIIGGAVVISGL